MAKNPESGILWLEVGVNNVNNIFRKATSVKNLKVKLHSFFPHCVWDHKVSLQHNLFQEQKTNNKLRYIIKPGIHDITLLTRQGSEPWQKTHIEQYGAVSPFKLFSNPPFQPTLRRTERPKRKEVTPIKVPSKRMGYQSPSDVFDNLQVEEIEVSVPETVTSVEESVQTQVESSI